MMELTATHRRRSKALRLTPELVALIARKVEDGGPAPGVVVHSEADYEASLQALLGFLYAECCTRSKAVKPANIVQLSR